MSLTIKANIFASPDHLGLEVQVSDPWPACVAPAATRRRWPLPLLWVLLVVVTVVAAILYLPWPHTQPANGRAQRGVPVSLRVVGNGTGGKGGYACHASQPGRVKPLVMMQVAFQEGQNG